ncbi:host specificity protein [Yersinia phage vB_YenP_Rambo]|uniref:Host specificity protein n=1 Tax=Yersinia phage vB_YenP_Rambo TaxID=2880894 RepID=A0AC61TNR7_9CAUD|nr:host specificity protein [Yersinia phage vB_YenP_Rambo]
MFTTTEVNKDLSRFTATMWSLDQLGLPKGFNGPISYSLFVNDIMDDSGLEEEYVMDSDGNLVAYYAWCVSQDLHHKGLILDVNSVVINPSLKPKGLHKFLTKRFKDLAVLNDCNWVSRAKHEDGTVRVFFKEV